MAVTMPTSAEALIRLLAIEARSQGLNVTPKMERQALKRVEAGESVFTLFGPKDDDDPETAHEGNWEQS